MYYDVSIHIFINFCFEYAIINFINQLVYIVIFVCKYSRSKSQSLHFDIVTFLHKSLVLSQ